MRTTFIITLIIINTLLVDVFVLLVIVVNADVCSFIGKYQITLELFIGTHSMIRN